MTLIFQGGVCEEEIANFSSQWQHLLSFFQIRPVGRRGGERRRGGGDGGINQRAGQEVRGPREVQDAAVADAETGIYLEIL